MYALYDRSLYVMVFLCVLMTAIIIVSIWEFSFPGGGGERFP